MQNGHSEPYAELTHPGLHSQPCPVIGVLELLGKLEEH